MNKIDKLRLLKFMVLAKEDPMYFIENYAKVEHPSKGPIPFVVQDFQKEYLDAMISGDTVIANGERQVGMTITALMYIFYYACTHENKTILLTAATHDQARDNINRILYAYEHLPEPLKYVMGVEKPQKYILEFSNGTHIRAMSTTPHCGRGLAVDLVHFDNFSNVEPTTQADIWYSLMPCLWVTKGQAIVSSTTNGRGYKFFRELYDSAAESSKVRAVTIRRNNL